MTHTTLVLIVFALTYLGMAAGRLPGLQLDRTGFALIGCVALMLGGAVAPERALDLIDARTLELLFALMLLSGQFALSGFYDWAAARIAAARAGPAGLLALTVAVSGGLSALLANDIVVFAMTPMLCAGIARRGLDVRPYLIALAAASNAGSAATLIGNPQNILIGQIGSRSGDALGFWPYFAWAAVPSAVALLLTFLIVWARWRRRLLAADRPPSASEPMPEPQRGALAKAVGALLALVLLFATELPHAVSGLAVAAFLLVSRRVPPRLLLARLDWPLLLLFACLFIVTGSFAATGLAEAGWRWLAGQGVDPARGPVLALLSLIGSNSIGNVPLVMLLLAAWPGPPAGALAGLALFSTLAGNLFLVGSLANLITVERAAAAGYRLGFLDHARCGIPIALASLAFGLLWFATISP